jgi:hypothetical protein
VSTAAVSAATTVETAAATVETATAMNRAAVEAANRPARISAASDESTSADEPASTRKPASADKATSAPTRAPSAASPVSVIPGPGADEHSAYEPVRPVIAVRRASIRIIVVVSVRAHRWSANIARPESHPHSNPDLRLRVSQRQHQDTHQSQIS